MKGYLTWRDRPARLAGDGGTNPSVKRISLTVAAIVGAVLVAYLSVGMERYCFVYPGIDTRYAAGFSERRFAKVGIGMTREEVLNLLGEPLGGASARASGSYRWSYTQDGKCFWADWAWLGREIVFANDRVSEKVARIYYD